jgi:hypothetical protein
MWMSSGPVGLLNTPPGLKQEPIFRRRKPRDPVTQPPADFTPRARMSSGPVGRLTTTQDPDPAPKRRRKDADAGEQASPPHVEPEPEPASKPQPA